MLGMNLFKKLSFWFDYYIGYFVTNGRKHGKYHKHFEQKWKDNI